MADESFTLGQRALNEGQIELGTEQVQDGLQFCEQVFGGVHPEASTKYHNLGIGEYKASRLPPFAIC